MAFGKIDFAGSACRYLQHRRSLTHVEMCQQDDLSVRELERVVMTVRMTAVDLTETGYLVAERAGKDEPGFASYLVLKGKLGARKQTNSLLTGSAYHRRPA